MKLTPWYLVALAPLAVAGCTGTFFGHFAVLAVTLCLFIGTLSLGRQVAASSSADTPPRRGSLRPPAAEPAPIDPLDKSA